MQKDKILSKNKEIFVIGVIFLMLFVLLLISVVQNNFLVKIDQSFQQSLSGIRTPAGITFLNALTHILNVYLLSGLILIIAIYLYFKHYKKESILILTSAVIGLALGEAISSLTQRARPLETLTSSAGYSFPSGHALAATMFFILLAIILHHHLKSKLSKSLVVLDATLLILLASFARVYLNVHWLSDVLASMFLGISVVCFTWLALKKIET